MFSNDVVRQPVSNKPNIAFIDGYWRVSKLPKRTWFNNQTRWTDAHTFARVKNSVLRLKGHRDASSSSSKEA